MTSLQVDRNLPEITPAQSLTRWRREPRSGSAGRRGAPHPPYQETCQPGSNMTAPRGNAVQQGLDRWADRAAPDLLTAAVLRRSGSGPRYKGAVRHRHQYGLDHDIGQSLS